MSLSLNQVSKGFLDETVLNDINLSIQEGDHIGLLGVNGVGKTTLLNILTGTLPYDSGVISTKKDLSIGYLKQNESLNSQNTLEEEIHLALQEVYTVREQLAEISAKMASTAPDSPAYLELTNAYEELSNQYAALDGYHADVRIQTVLNGLGFGKFRLDGKISTLSGGEKIRFAMAKVLLQNPELLILDEPTNHLDFSMLTWLEEYLTAYKGAVVVVSHDRYFLNRVASDICELERGTLYRYKGGYSAFLVQKEERIRALEKEYKKQQADLEAMREYVRRNLAKSSSTNSVGSRVKALEKMELAAKPNPRQKKAHFTFEFDYEPHKTVLEVRDLGVFVGNGATGKQLYEHLSFSIEKGEKIALVGQNGVGKSSLLKAILKKLPYSGTVRIGGNVKISYFDQELANLNLNDTVLEAVHRRFPGKTELEIRSALGKLLIEDESAFKRIKELSGANRAKVAFCIIMFERSNFLILDEPTNHLDYTAKESLDEALQQFSGTMLTVSHDRYFLSRVPTKIIEMFPDRLCIYKGGYNEYLAAKSATVQASEPVEKKAVSEQKQAYETNRKNKAEERKRRAKLAALQKEIESLYMQCSALKAECELPEVVDDYVRLTALTEEIEIVENTIEERETEWLTLSES